jgi:hypothetical protein
MCNVLKNSISQEQEMVSQRRINTFKQNLIQDWNSTRKQTYTWVRDQTPYQTPCFKTGVHEYATKHAEIHQMMLDSWSPIFNRFIQNAPPSYDDFLRAFPMALPENRLYSADNPVVLPQITCDDVMALIAQLKPSSPGADAWRIEELQVLGRRSISYLVKFYELVENVGKWPQNLLEVPVASLQKNSGDSPLDIRPISLTSHMYRLWAKLRWQQLQDWHLSWCPDELKGGIAGRETVDAYYQVALEIEHANFTNSPLFGILFDYQKCFDNVAWSIERGILRDLGLPMPILNSMMAFNENINRRFKLGSSVGPKFGNTNSICQGCPLAILRINSLITTWVHVIQKHPDTQLCKTNAFIDDKNLRAPSFNSLMTANQVTQSFDVAVGAVVNPTKTVVFANTSQGRKELAACEYPTVTDERLLGASLSFTKKRSKKLANKRAQAYLTVAQRINVCPLNMPAREILLATAGATKFSFGIEMGSCNLKVERTLRSAVARCLWTKGNHKSTDILFSICHKGHLFDPVQLKIYLAFKIARRQLIKHPHIHQLWSQIWQNSATHRGQYRDGRSNMVGPLSNLAIACKSISWEWVEPFLFTRQISETHNLRIPFLDIPEAYFHHLIRFAINQMLWKRASNARKNLRGVHLGIDKSTTAKLLNTQALSPYDKGILKAIFADGITTQKHLFVMKKAAHPVCHFCWCAVETLEHLFWQCPHWNTIRQSRLSVQQITECQQLPLCTQRSGLFLTTANQFQQFFRSHDRIWHGHNAVHTPAHSCDFVSDIHITMIEIIKARNQDEGIEPPDGFDPSPFLPVVVPTPDSVNMNEPYQDSSQPQDRQAQKLQSKPSHSPDGLLYSTSLRPGASQYQYVQFIKKTQKYKATIPHNGKRHSFGPFDSEVQAAERVREFLKNTEQTSSVPTRGEKRTEMFHFNLDQQLQQLNLTARDEKRHHVGDTHNPTCSFCNKSVHTYHAIKFARQQCPSISNQVDKKGSATRAKKLSETRTAALQEKIDAHNRSAISKKQHYISSLNPPICKFCQKTVTRNHLKTWMIKQCDHAPDPSNVSNSTSSNRRLRGKQSCQLPGA